MGKLVVGNVPQGFEKANDWYLTTIEDINRLRSKDGKPMVKIDFRINDALTENGQHYIGQAHMEWFLVKNTPMEEGEVFEDIDWDPYSFGVQRLVKVYLCVPHTDTDDTEEILEQMKQQQVWIRLQSREGNSNIVDAKPLEIEPAGFEGKSKLAEEMDELPF